MTDYLAIVLLIDLIGTSFFLAGLTGTFAEIQYKLTLVAAILNKPTTADEIR